MEKKLKAKKTWRLSLFITVCISLVYGLKFISLNYIFNINSIVLFKNEADVFFGLPQLFNLQVTISRWWDLIFIFVDVFFLVKVFASIKENQTKNSYLSAGLVFSFLAGLAVGGVSSMMPGFMVGVEAAIFLGLIFGLLFGLIFGMELGLGFSLESGMVAGLLSSLIFILFFGSIVGIVFGLILFLIITTATTAGTILKYLFSKELWGNLIN